MSETKSTGAVLAERFLRMLNDHNPDAVDDFVAVDYINHNEFVEDGREGNRAFWADFFTAFPDITGTMEDLVVAGDRVVGRFIYRGTHLGPLCGIPPPGTRSRCGPSTSGGSRTVSSWSIGTSSTFSRCSRRSG